jgi:lipopolysaccharide transport system ATP-binding protein
MVEADGDAHVVAAGYLKSELGTTAQRSWGLSDNAPGDDVARLKSVRILQENKIVDMVDIRYPIVLEMEYWNLRSNARLMVAANFFDNDGLLLFVSADHQETEWLAPRRAGIYVSRCIVPGNFFSEGIIRVMAEVCTREPFWLSHVREMDVVSFNVVDTGQPGSVRFGWVQPIQGVIRPMLDWRTECVDSPKQLFAPVQTSVALSAR